MLFSTIFLSSLLFQAAPQQLPLTCQEIIGDLYIQSTQQQRYQQRQISDLQQQLATAQAELAKLKEAK